MKKVRKKNPVKKKKLSGVVSGGVGKTGKRVQREKHNKVQFAPVEGLFTAAQGGFGFVDRARGKGGSVFIPPSGVGNAITGDRVLVEVTDPNGARNLGPAGRIVQILERTRKTVVGELLAGRELRTLDERMKDGIKVTGSTRGTHVGDWVKVRLLSSGKKFTEHLKGEIVENLGDVGSLEADLKAVVAEFDLPDPYTEKENEAAKRLKARKVEQEDLRDLFTVTIDPADAKDFDDGISISEGEEKGTLLLGVHIADVALWIKEDSALDRKARSRGFSSYIPGMFQPMLPKSLTERVSLKQGEDCAAHSFLFTLRKSTGKILGVKRCHSLVRVDARLDYDTVQNFLDHPRSTPENWSGELKEKISLLLSVVKKMRAQRMKQEMPLPIETTETRVLLSPEDWQIKGLRKEESRLAEALVEECMLAANSAAACELIEKEASGLYRVHDEPDPGKMEEFSNLMRYSFRLHTGDLFRREKCVAFLDELKNNSVKGVILSNFLRSLPRAVYSSAPSLHFGLGKYRYCHFTSPIRRYTDLAIHRQFLALDGYGKLQNGNFFTELAEHCTALEERNDNAYFAASDRLKLHYLFQITRAADEEGAIPPVYEGVIAKVSSAGLLCDIPELGLYGFIPASKLSRGGVHFNKHRKQLRSERGHDRYKCSDVIFVVLDSLDFVRGRALFRPV
ncbi:MAG: VacB/RNase II family 3'-5' exoribonuclease [Lentisphaeria bacterium]|nr:VacB/RNase II family 3'-5' exoribonuclease [Lentisphaeria bacterium]